MLQDAGLALIPLSRLRLPALLAGTPSPRLTIDALIILLPMVFDFRASFASMLRRASKRPNCFGQL